MILAYFAFILAFVLFCRNAGLGGRRWERSAILFVMAAPTALFCATALGAFVLYILLELSVVLIVGLAAELAATPAQQLA